MGTIRLGDFVVGDVLGRGGMGVVLRAVHEPTGFPVAIKGITAAAARRGDVLAALGTEVRAVASLDHPAIVAVLEHGIVDPTAAAESGGALGAGSPWLAMELASGGTLQALTGPDSAPLRWTGLRAMLLRLLDALAHAHARGVLHLDIKPANVLLGAEGDARPGLKLVDFGLARRIEPDPREALETDRNDAAGTPLYMAPEQFEGAARAFGPWTDLYALGGLAWALATGAPAVAAQDVFAIAFAHLRGDRRPFRPRLAVPDGFEGWLEDLLRLSPERRFQRAADAAFALAALPDPDDDAPPPAPPPLALVDATTLGSIFRSAPTLPPVGGPSPADSGRHPAPPVPVDWRTQERPRPLPQLVGAGLALWGLREQPVVGREPQRDALWAALRQVHARGLPRVVLLTGGAGSGKSRLASWLSRRAHEVGAAVTLRATHGRTLGAEDGLGPMLARAFGCVGLGSQEAFDRLRTLVPDPALAGAIGEIIAPSPTPRHAFETPEQRWLAIGGALRALAVDRPVVLWLDDLQWGLQATRFAVWLAGQDLGALVVGTWRDDEVLTDEHGRRLARLRDRDNAETVSVEPLPPSDGLALVRELLDLEEMLARQVAERTAGNPLFAVQLVGDWVERGALESTVRGFRLRAGASDALPGSLSAVWRRRVDRLLQGRSDGEVHALELAAALGQRVHSGEWTALCARCGADSFGTLLDGLFQAGLAVPSEEGPAGSWAFVHGLLREAIQERAERAGRGGSNHRACASMLRERGVGPARLGPHLLAGGAYADAAAVLLQAGRAAKRSSDLPQARVLLGQWQRAQELAERPDSHPSWLEGLLTMAEVERASGFLEHAEQLAERGLAGAQARGDEVGEARLLTELGRVRLNQGDYDVAIDLAQRAFPVLDAAGEAAAASDALRTLAIVAMARGRWDDAVDAFERARLRLEAAGERIKVGYCLVGLAQVDRHQRRFDAAADHLRAAQELFEAVGYRMGRAECANGLGEIARYEGDLAAAEAAYREALSLYSELGSIDVPVARANLGLVQSARGSWAGAKESLEAARRAFSLEKRRDLEAACCAALLPPAAATGDDEAFDRLFARSSELLDRTGFVYADVATEAERAGQLAADRGDVHRSRRAFELALAQWTGLHRDADAERVRAILGGAVTGPGGGPGGAARPW